MNNLIPNENSKIIMETSARKVITILAGVGSAILALLIIMTVLAIWLAIRNWKNKETIKNLSEDESEKLKSLRSEREEFNLRIEEKDETIRQRLEMAKIHTEEIKKLKGEKVSLEENLKEIIVDRRKKITDLKQKSKDDLETNKKEYEKRLSEIKKEYNDKLSENKKAIELMNRTIKDLSEDNQSMKRREGEVNNINNENRKLKDDLEEASTRIKELMGQNEKLNREKENLKNRNEVLMKNIEDLENFKKVKNQLQQPVILNEISEYDANKMTSVKTKTNENENNGETLHEIDLNDGNNNINSNKEPSSTFSKLKSIFKSNDNKNKIKD